jgi:hypothetical protein
MYVIINLRKENIKVKKLKIGENAFIKTDYDIKHSKISENFPYILIGKEVKIISKINESMLEVEDIEDSKHYLIHTSAFSYANAFSYITSIIDSNFRKVRNAAHNYNLSQKFFNQFESPDLNNWLALTNKEKKKISNRHKEYIVNRNKELEKNPVKSIQKNNVFTINIKE